MRRVEADNIRVAAAIDVYQKRLTCAVGICHGSGHLDVACGASDLDKKGKE